MKAKVQQIVMTKAGKPNKSIINMLNNCNFNFGKNMVGTGYYSGTGRFTSRHSAMGTVVQLLSAGGFKFETSDTAGAGKEHVKMSKKAFDFLTEIKNLK